MNASSAKRAKSGRGENLSFSSVRSELEARITASLNELSGMIELPSRQAVSRLSQFVNQYAGYLADELTVMSHNPDSQIDELEAAIEDLCIREIGAAHYLHWRGEISQSRPDTLLQLCLTYMAGRTLEVASECALSKGLLPLTRFELGTANQVIATLLGEKLTQKIDQLSDSVLNWTSLSAPLAEAVFDTDKLAGFWTCVAEHHGLAPRRVA